MALVLCVAAVLGNTTNYWIGRRIGQHAFSGRYRFIKVDYLRQTEAWFAKHGALAMVLARFAPSCAPSRPSWPASAACTTAVSRSTTSLAESCG